MANLILSNNSAQVECTLSQTYCRLIGACAAPLIATSAANSGFLVKNANNQPGLFVGNTCFCFYNNNLNFDYANTDLFINIPDTKNFIVTGNGSIMDFNGNGTLSVGTSIDLTYKGLQVVNSSPILLLKDTDASAQSGNQAINFYDSTGSLFTSFCNDPSSSVNSLADNATYIVYNKYFRLKNNSNIETFIVSGCNLTLFSGNCLNKAYNFAVGGTSYFTSDVFSSGIINANGICSFAVNNYFKGSGDNVGLNICNNKTNSSGFINFYNECGGLYASINSSQSAISPYNGGSELNFYTTPIGAYSNSDRRQLAFKISGDKLTRFYGNTCAETGFYSCQIRSFGIENSGCRTYLAPDSQAFHFFGSNANNCAYGISINTNSVILNHLWLTSGRSSMCLDYNQNLTISGYLNSSGINSSSGLIVDNKTFTDSCIISRCVALRASGANQNLILSGNLINYGQTAIFSGICSTGNQINNISGCICVQDSLYSKALYLTSGICSTSGCFTNYIQSQIICSNSCIKVDSVCSIGTNLNYFCGSICTSGYIQADNTSKSWGHFELTDGLATNCTGYNFNSLIICSNSSAPAGTINFLYGLKLNNAVKYPFSLQMSVMPKGVFAWNPTLLTGSNQTTFSTFGAGTAGSTAFNMPNYIIPICSGKTPVGLAQGYISNCYYCELYFTILSCKYFTSEFSGMCKNFHDANIMFTINSL